MSPLTEKWLFIRNIEPVDCQLLENDEVAGFKLDDRGFLIPAGVESLAPYSLISGMRSAPTIKLGSTGWILLWQVSRFAFIQGTFADLPLFRVY